MPGLSIVIPHRNRPECLRRCIGDLLAQKTTFPLEIVVADDHSTDDSLVFLIQGDYGVKVFRYKEDKGFNLSRARNIGIMFASHDLVFTFDVDNRCLQDGAIQRLWYDWLYYEEVARQGGIPALSPYKPEPLAHSWKELVNYDSVPYRKNGVVLKTVGWGNALFHKSVFNVVGGYDHETFNAKGYEDAAFFLIAFRQNYYPVQDAKTLKRKANPWIVNFKDKELPEEKRVEVNDVWESDDMARNYKKYQELVFKRPKVMRNEVDLDVLRRQTERVC